MAIFFWQDMWGSGSQDIRYHYMLISLCNYEYDDGHFINTPFSLPLWALLAAIQFIFNPESISCCSSVISTWKFFCGSAKKYFGNFMLVGNKLVSLFGRLLHVVGRCSAKKMFITISNLIFTLLVCQHVDMVNCMER